MCSRLRVRFPCTANFMHVLHVHYDVSWECYVVQCIAMSSVVNVWQSQILYVCMRRLSMRTINKNYLLSSKTSEPLCWLPEVWQCKAPTANYFRRASSVSAGLTRDIVMVSSLMHSVHKMSQLSASVFFLDRRSWAHPANNSLGNKRLCLLSWAPFWYPKLSYTSVLNVTPQFANNFDSLTQKKYALSSYY